MKRKVFNGLGLTVPLELRLALIALAGGMTQGALMLMAQPGWAGSQIPRVRDLQRPVTSVKEWLAQVEAATAQITNIKLNRTDTGLEINLETAEGRPLQVDATKFRQEGTSLIADIPNAVLALPKSQGFRADNPTEEIANVRVTQVDATMVR
ncbi:AMIN domain-containing protein [Leptolyngbyaceae cyanobacterium UHCC 1019]